MTTKNGKTPVSERNEFISPEEAFGGSTFDIPPEVKADMAKKGWVPRWLNLAEVQKRNGRHPRGYHVYKRPNDVGTSILGGNPDGLILNGDLVLGYKGKNEMDVHKKYVRQQRAIQASQHAGNQDFKRFAQANKVKVVEDLD